MQLLLQLSLQSCQLKFPLENIKAFVLVVNVYYTTTIYNYSYSVQYKDLDLVDNLSKI